MSQEQEMQVSKILQDKGIKATYEYPSFILVTLPNNKTATFGTSNGYWTGDYRNHIGAYLGHFQMEDLPPETDPQTVADKIESVLDHPIIDN